MSKKGQVAVEFFIYAGIFLTIAITAYALTHFTERGEVALRESQYLYEFGQRFSYASTIAYRGGEGFTYDFYFPAQLDGKDFELYFFTETWHDGSPIRSSVLISWQGTYQNYTYSYIIPTADYNPAAGGCARTITHSAGPSARGKVVKVDTSGGRLIMEHMGDGFEEITLRCEQ